MVCNKKPVHKKAAIKAIIFFSGFCNQGWHRIPVPTRGISTNIHQGGVAYVIKTLFDKDGVSVRQAVLNESSRKINHV